MVDTGCVSVANAKAGFKMPAAAELAGPGLKEICGALGIPPVLHMGSCVDNVRILVLVSALADAPGVDISDMPVAGAAQELKAPPHCGIPATIKRMPQRLAHATATFNRGRPVFPKGPFQSTDTLIAE